MLRRLASCLLAPLLLAAASCTPTYLLSVRTTYPHPHLPDSENYAEAATADSVRLALRFVGYEPEWLVFEAEYHNDSPHPVSIDPAAFAQVPVRQVRDLRPPASRVHRGEVVPAAVAAATQHAPWPALPAALLPALNPVAGANDLQEAADLAAAKARRPDWLGVALLAVSLGADVAGATNRRETPTQYRSRALLHDLAWTYSAVSTANRVSHAATAEELTRRANRLREFSLRRGQLLPGQQVRGYVYLPRFDTADQLQVLAPLGQDRVVLDFAQVHRRQ